MKTEITLKTRREFLRTTVLGSALSWTMPAFLSHTFFALHAEACAKSATLISTGKDSSILVVLQMAGGNDGLNTVVPHANDYYRKARPRLGLAEKDILKINDDIALDLPPVMVPDFKLVPTPHFPHSARYSLANLF